MKNTQEKLPIANCRLPIERQNTAVFSTSKSRASSRSAFTLIELLTVIAIIAVIAAFTLVVVAGIKKTEYVNAATAELVQIETALDNYQHKYGVYPPSNASLTPLGNLNLAPLENTLYYELSGVYPTNKPGVGAGYETLDGASFISQLSYQAAFTGSGTPPPTIDGIINCSKGSAEEGTQAQNFLLGLRQNRFGISTNNAVALTNLITSVRGPDSNYRPLGGQDVNPFRYLYPGTNNPSSYDLWVQLQIRGKTYLICNWSKQVIVNSPLP